MKPFMDENFLFIIRQLLPYIMILPKICQSLIIIVI